MISGAAMSQTTLCNPYIINVNLDSVRTVKTSERQYLDDLEYMQKNVKQNQTNLKNCISDMKNSLKNINNSNKMTST